MELNIQKEVERFKEIHGKTAFLKLSVFLSEFRKKYERNKINYFHNKGDSLTEAQKKSRQSWVAYVGRQLENLIQLFLIDFCTQFGLKMVKGSELKKSNLEYDLSIVRRKIEVNFNEYSLLPDAEIIIYKKYGNNIKVIAILSIKNSFRERYTETPYWKLKLMQDVVTKHIKVFMVTSDNDDEVSFINQGGPRQARIVMAYELDSIYLARENFHPSNKVKSLDKLLIDLKDIIRE